MKHRNICHICTKVKYVERVGCDSRYPPTHESHYRYICAECLSLLRSIRSARGGGGVGGRMKREGLRRRLALAAVELLRGHKKSFVNITRYVVPHLTDYGIRRDSKIGSQDILAALEMMQNASKQNPTSFFTAPVGSPLAARRRDFFLNSPLAILIEDDREQGTSDRRIQRRQEWPYTADPAND